MLKELGHFATLQFSRFRNIINLESTIIFLLNFFSEDFPEIFSRRERERAAKRQKRIVRRRGENEDGKFCLGKM